MSRKSISPLYPNYNKIKSNIKNYSTTIGDATNTSFTITHNLNVNSVQVTIKDKQTGYLVSPDIKIINNSLVALTIEFASGYTPALNQYLVTITGF